MKKYIITYVAMLLVAILLIYTKGIPWMKKVAYVRTHSFDGFSHTFYLLPGNVVIAVVCLLILIIITVRSSNKVPMKWIILLGIINVFLHVSYVYVVPSGGFIGKTLEGSYYNLGYPDALRLFLLTLT